MAQHAYTIANQSGASFRSDLNNALAAIVSSNSAATAPSTTFAYQFWADTTSGWLKQRNSANSAWIFIQPLGGHGEQTVASATTTDLGAQVSDSVLISGTTTITSFGTADAGRYVLVRHSGALTLTHNATSLILPGGSSIVTAAGDTYEALSLGAGNWVVKAYQPAAGYGFRNLPQNSKSAAYTTVMGDAGCHILHPSADTTARTFTIDSNATVPYIIGTAITFVNQASAGVMTIAITTDTMRLAGAGTTGSRTLAANGIATAIKLTSTEWIISGTGLT